MLHFIQNFVYYTKFDVIEPELERKLNATKEYCSNIKKSKGDDDNMMLNGQFPRTVDNLLHGQTQCKSEKLVFDSSFINFHVSEYLHPFFIL